MQTIKVTTPSPHQILPKTFFAAGRGRGTLKAVQGRLTADGQTVVGLTVALTYDGKTAMRRRWLILFRNVVLPEDVVTLRVDWETTDGESGTEVVEGLLINRKLIDVNFPPAGRYCGENFVAYGPLGQGHALASAKLGNTNASLTSMTDDGLMWVAQFPVLSNGTYTLQVDDSGGHTANVPGIEIDNSLC